MPANRPLPPYRLHAADARAVAAYLLSLPGNKDADGTRQEKKSKR